MRCRASQPPRTQHARAAGRSFESPPLCPPPRAPGTQIDEFLQTGTLAALEGEEAGVAAPKDETALKFL